MENTIIHVNKFNHVHKFNHKSITDFTELTTLPIFADLITFIIAVTTESIA